jgi:hypothetical protein
MVRRAQRATSLRNRPCIRMLFLSSSSKNLLTVRSAGPLCAHCPTVGPPTTHTTTTMLLCGTITVLAMTALAVAQDSTPCSSYDINTGNGGFACSKCVRCSDGMSHHSHGHAWARTRWCVIVSEGQEPEAWPHVENVEATHSSSASPALRWPNDVGLPHMDGIVVWLCGLRATAKRLTV